MVSLAIDYSSTVFNAGEQLSGNVLVQLVEDIKAVSIKLEIRGRVNWIWKRNDRSQTVQQGSEELVSQDLYLWGTSSGGDSGDSTSLVSGKHDFPFNFPIPSNCPTSFESTHGYVRYFTRAIISRPSSSHFVKKMFSVVFPINLNANPAAAQRYAESRQNARCLVCCKSGGPISAELILGHRGLVPGQHLPLKLHVENKSARPVDQITAELCQWVGYFANSKQEQKECRQIIENKVPNSVQVDGTKDVDFSPEMTIPAIPPTTSQSRLIQISYVLNVKVSSSGKASSGIKFCIPIIIGTIPVEQSYKGSVPASSLLLSDYPSHIPLPSYEECMFGRIKLSDVEKKMATGEKNSQEEWDQPEFAPKYPVYRF